MKNAFRNGSGCFAISTCFTFPAAVFGWGNISKNFSL